MKLFLSKNIVVQESPVHGIGVFAEDDLKEGVLVEQSLVIHPKKMFNADLDETYRKYFFYWPALKGDWNKLVEEQGNLELDQISYPVCATGFAMLYNHQKRGNLRVSVSIENNIIEFRAARDIEKGEELFISYGPLFQNLLNEKRNEN